jgi:hypothetical protein
MIAIWQCIIEVDAELAAIRDRDNRHGLDVSGVVAKGIVLFLAYFPLQPSSGVDSPLSG